MSFKTIQALRKIVVDTPSFTSNHEVDSDDSVATKKYVDDNVGGVTEEEDTVAITFTGPWAAPVNVNVVFYKLGKMAHMILPQFSALHSVDSRITAAAGSVPLAYRPSVSAFTQTIVVKNGPASVDGSDDYLGSCIVGVDGSLTLAAASRDGNDIIVFTVFDAFGETVGTPTTQCVNYCL